MMKKQQGFSIVEMLIVFGLMGFAALAYVALQENASKGQKRVETKYDELEIKRLITSQLLDYRACQHTFVTEEHVLGSTVKTIKNQANIATPYTENAVINQNLKIISMKTENISPALGVIGIHDAELVVHLKKLKVGTGDLNLRIPLKMTVDGSNKVLECFSDTNAIITTAHKKICEDLGGHVDPATGKCADAGLQAPKHEGSHYQTYPLNSKNIGKYKICVTTGYSFCGWNSMCLLTHGPFKDGKASWTVSAISQPGGGCDPSGAGCHYACY